MKRRFNLNIGCIIKILIVLAIIMGLFLLINQCSGGACIRKIDKTLPDIQVAPWEVITPTHLYYAEVATDNGELIILKGWYEQVDKKWVKHTGEIVLERKVYGIIDVKRR